MPIAGEPGFNIVLVALTIGWALVLYGAPSAARRLHVPAPLIVTLALLAGPVSWMLVIATQPDQAYANLYWILLVPAALAAITLAAATRLFGSARSVGGAPSFLAGAILAALGVGLLVYVGSAKLVFGP